MIEGHTRRGVAVRPLLGADAERIGRSRLAVDDSELDAKIEGNCDAAS